MKKKIIIAGGTGFIGTHLTRLLVKKDYHVIILTRHLDSVNLANDMISYVLWDGKTQGAWTESLENSEAVINLAGASISKRWTKKRKRFIEESRVNSGVALAEAAAGLKKKPKVFIQASAVGYYGAGRNDDTLNEESAPGSDFLAETAKLWEDSSLEVEKAGIRRVIVRTGVVLGRDGGALSLMTLPFKFFVGGKLGDGSQWVPWIHIDDEVGALFHLLKDKKSEGVYNLTAPNPVTNAEMTKIIGRLMKRPAFFKVPAILLKAILGKMSVIILGGQRAVPTRLEEEEYEFRYVHLKNALANLLLN